MNRRFQASVVRVRLQTGPHAKLGNHIGERPPLDELHGVIVDAPFATHRVNGNDVLMMEMGGRLRLIVKPL